MKETPRIIHFLEHLRFCSRSGRRPANAPLGESCGFSRVQLGVSVFDSKPQKPELPRQGAVQGQQPGHRGGPGPTDPA